MRAVRFGCSRQPATGCIPQSACSFECELVALRDRPVQATKTGPLGRRACGRAQQSIERFEHLRIGAESLCDGIGAAKTQPRTEHLHLVVRGLRKEIVRMLDRRNTGVVALHAIEGRKPKNSPPQKMAAKAKSPNRFLILRSVRRRSKNRSRCWRGR